MRGVTIAKVFMGCMVLPMIGFCGCMGAVFTIAVAGDVAAYFGSSDWERAEAVVTDVEIVESEDEEGDVTSRPVISYEFMLSGTKYTGDRAYFGNNISIGDEDLVERTAAQYSVGQDIMVFYDPDDPTNSVISRDANGALWAFLAVGLVILAISIAAFCAMLYMFVRWKPAPEGADKPKGKPKNEPIPTMAEQFEDTFMGVVQSQGIPAESMDDLRNMTVEERRAIYYRKSNSVLDDYDIEDMEDLDDFKF